MTRTIANRLHAASGRFGTVAFHNYKMMDFLASRVELVSPSSR
jgi:hypothetical protein